MNRHPDRIPSNIIVTVPDLSAVAAEACGLYNKAHPEKRAKAMVYQAIGYVQTERGMFVLSEEGVGDSRPITSENPDEIAFCAAYEDGGWAVFPDAHAHLNDAELLCLPTLKEVPLEEFIRSFGARLESNYEQWRRALTAAKPMKLENCG